MNIFYGRENIDKFKFLFNQVGTNNSNTYIIVPEQFTLEAEKSAFEHMQTKSLMDIEIISFSRLGHKILKEVGGEKVSTLNNYGRYMLLSKIMKDSSHELKLFHGMEKMPSFLENLNDLFSEMKEFSTDTARLGEVTGKLPQTSVLRQKLDDLEYIYNQYHHTISNAYLDSDDYTAFFTNKIKHSVNLKKYSIWIYGFEYFSPKLLNIIKELENVAKSVNIILTWDKNGRDNNLFDITSFVINKLKIQSLSNGFNYRLSQIDDFFGVVDLTKDSYDNTTTKTHPFTINKCPELKHLEQELFAIPYQTFHKPSSDALTASKQKANPSLYKKEFNVNPNEQFNAFISPVKIIKAANPTSEIETAAMYASALIREKNLRQKDIVILSNELDNKSHIFKRIFHQYGLNIFIDIKQNIMNHPMVELIIYLLTLGRGTLNSETIIGFMKTGFLNFTKEEEERLENYAYSYQIKSWQWKNDFVKGKDLLGEEDFTTINLLRKRLFDILTPFLNDYAKAKTGMDKSQVLYSFLINDLNLMTQLNEIFHFQESNQFLEEASVTSQIWDVFVDILNQISTLMTDDILSADLFLDIIKQGFISAKVGVLPANNDAILIGTMKRTRINKAKVLMVLSANDGSLPAITNHSSILNDDEKISLFDNSIAICKNRNIEIQEENLSIYRNCAKPSEYFYISCYATNSEGVEVRPSPIFNKVTKIFPDIKISTDIHTLNNPWFMSIAKSNAIKYLGNQLKKDAEKNLFESQTSHFSYSTNNDFYDFVNQFNWRLHTLHWFKKNNSPSFNNLTKGLFFNTKTKNLSINQLDNLYKKTVSNNFSISPSALENYSRCPFAYFINYGLKPTENRRFEVSHRELGDIYHLCLMKLSQKLTLPNIPITSPESPWMNFNLTDCEIFVNNFLEKELPFYREGVFLKDFKHSSESEYKKERVKRVCVQSAYNMVLQVQQGNIEKMFFETSFGEHHTNQFKGLIINEEITTKNTTPKNSNKNNNVIIEGKIDRVDILPDEYIKIIDYKSGFQKFNKKLAEKGISLQLMLYLKAIEQNYNTYNKAAGIFYFKIQEPLINIASTGDTKKVEESKTREFKLDGLVLNDEKVIKNLAGDFKGHSPIIPVQNSSKKGFTGSNLLSKEEFEEFQRNMDKVIKKICYHFTKGAIDISPIKWENESSCSFCKFHSICKFEKQFNNQYRY